jgi:uncharacterized protein YecE (DUF72 family)
LIEVKAEHQQALIGQRAPSWNAAEREPCAVQNLYIGCAGWSIRKEHVQEFSRKGSHLERYAARFPAVEINSSFYRPHRPATYARWAASVPAEFRFAVKVPRAITHECRLIGAIELLDRFLAEAGALGPKLGPLLVQLPPSLIFDAAIAGRFFTDLRQRFHGAVVCEPRHRSWFETTPDQLLASFQVARVTADPAVVPYAAEPGGWCGLTYYRLHGTPRVYWSSYPLQYLDVLAHSMTAARGVMPFWCIFDNTALGAATANALYLLARLSECPAPCER